MNSNKETHPAQVSKLLLSGNYITQEIAIKNFRCFRLSSVIGRLRHDKGMSISTYTPITALQNGIITHNEFMAMGSDDLGIYHMSNDDINDYISTHQLTAKAYGLQARA